MSIERDFIERRAHDRARREEIMRRLQGSVWTCPACGQTWFVARAGEAAAHTCKACHRTFAADRC